MTYKLNEDLVRKQKISKEDEKDLHILYALKDVELERMELMTDSKMLREKSHLLRTLEFRIQKAWKFERNPSFHRFWLEPHCTCPKMDNEDRWGTSHTIIDNECPCHGTVPSSSIMDRS